MTDIEETWIYYGVVKLNGGGHGHKFIPLVEGKLDLDNTSIFGMGKGWRTFTVGGHYRVTLVNKGQSVSGSPKWNGSMWKDTELVAQWGASSKAIEGAKRLAAREKKLKDDPLREALDPIRRAMRGASDPERAVLLSWVVKELLK